MDILETRTVALEAKVEDRGTSQSARKTCQLEVGVQARERLTQSSFSVMTNEVQVDPNIILIGDFLARHQN